MKKYHKSSFKLAIQLINSGIPSNLLYKYSFLIVVYLLPLILLGWMHHAVEYTFKNPPNLFIKPN